MAQDAPFADQPDLGYAGFALDRLGDARNDPEVVAAEARSPARRTALLAGDRLALRPAADGALRLLFDQAEAARLGAGDPQIFLGRSPDGPVFAATVAEDLVADGVALEDLRALASEGRVAGADLALAGCAKSLLSWHARHRFCANCGAATAQAAGGWRRDCPTCGAHHFPRVDPVVIMLVTRGERCLLGRQPRFPAGMWSCLAGFVEPGETLEEAVRRETLEEAGVAIGRVSYELSQPWPFPSQLMVGMRAEALGEELRPDYAELDDARWFDREEAAAMLERRHPQGWFAPPPAAIAHHLLRRFVSG